VAPTLWAFIIGDSHIAVQGDSDNTTLGRLELIAIQLHRKSVRQNDMMSNAKNGLRISRGRQGVDGPTSMVPSMNRLQET